MAAISTMLNIIKVQSIITKKFDGLSLHGLNLADFMILQYIF